MFKWPRKSQTPPQASAQTSSSESNASAQNASVPDKRIRSIRQMQTPVIPPPQAQPQTALTGQVRTPESEKPQNIALKQKEIEALVHIRESMRGQLPDKIPLSLREDVLVIALPLASVAVLYKTGASSKAQFSNLQQSLRDFRVMYAFAVDDATFISLREQVSSLRNSNYTAIADHDERGKRLFEELVQEAYRLGASDIHFKLRDQGQSEVRLRLFGRMRPWQHFDSITLINAVASAYSSKTKFGTNSRSGFELGVESSTMTEHFFDGKVIMGRFAHRPILGGGKTVLRLLETSNDPKQLRIKSFETLGYAKSQIDEQIMPALRKNTGLILLAGSTGSGKSTTLRSMMYAIPGLDQLELYSVEDPTEYVMPWVNQISIQSSADDSDEVRRSKFLSSLRSMMRMDPDVAMIGEIRDTESAKIATEMTQTGHRVLSTVHGDGGIDVMGRMTGDLLQVPPDILSSKRYLSASIYQKLMPVLCPKCKIPARSILPQETFDVLERKFGMNTDKMFCAFEEGCDECRLPGIDTQGTRGQTVVAELICPNDAMRSAMKQKDWIGLERIWRGQRRTGFDDADMTGKTAYEHALYKCSIGLIDPRDIELDFEPFSLYQIMPIEAQAAPINYSAR